jgi:hypothetical protein
MKKVVAFLMFVVVCSVFVPMSSGAAAPEADILGGELRSMDTSASLDAAAPETDFLCGKVWWCCWEMRCENGAADDKQDFNICPASYAQPKTREGAFKAWTTHLLPQLETLRKNNKGAVCWVRAENCYEELHGKPCGHWPNL